MTEAENTTKDNSCSDKPFSFELKITNTGLKFKFICTVLHSVYTAQFSYSLAMVQLILPRPDPIQVQSHIMPSFGLS